MLFALKLVQRDLENALKINLPTFRAELTASDLQNSASSPEMTSYANGPVFSAFHGTNEIAISGPDTECFDEGEWISSQSWRGHSLTGSCQPSYIIQAT